MPRSINLGMSAKKYAWWEEACKLAFELDTTPAKIIHEALEIGMPTLLEVLRVRSEAKKKEDAIKKHIK